MIKYHILSKGVSASATLSVPTDPGRRILVVDDEPAIRQLNSKILLRSGYVVDTAVDGVAAWQSLKAANYDLLITDNAMPNLSGVELLQMLYADQHMLPVIMATARPPQAEFDQSPWLQPAAILLKPYSFDALVETVKAVLRAAVRNHPPASDRPQCGGWASAGDCSAALPG